MSRQDRQARKAARQENRHEKQMAKIAAKTERVETRQESENILAKQGIVEKAWVGDMVSNVAESAGNTLSNMYGKGNKPGQPSGNSSMLLLGLLAALLMFGGKLFKG